MSKKFVLAVLIIMTMGLTACGGITGKVRQKTNTIEVGSVFDTSAYFNCKNGVSIKIKDINSVDTSKLGEISAEFIITNGDKEEEKTFKFDVIDTQAPIIDVNNITIYTGSDFIPENYVDCTDNSGEIVTAKVKSNNVDTSTAGTYSVIYEAIDSSGNTAEQTVSVEVISIETVEDVMDLIDEYLTQNGYDDFKYNKNEYDAVFISGPKMSGLSLNSDRKLTIYPEVYILQNIFDDNKYGVSSIIFRMEFMDSGVQSSRYNLSADKMKINSGSDTISIDDGILELGDFETSYYLSKFAYSVDSDDLKKFMTMVNNESMTFEIELQDEKSDYSTFPIKTTYTTIPITYGLNDSDMQILRQIVEICSDMLDILGEY